VVRNVNDTWELRARKKKVKQVSCQETNIGHSWRGRKKGANKRRKVNDKGKKASRAEVKKDERKGGAKKHFIRRSRKGKWKSDAKSEPRRGSAGENEIAISY